MVVPAIGITGYLWGNLRKVNTTLFVVVQKRNNRNGAFDKQRWISAFLKMLFHVLHTGMITLVKPCLQALLILCQFGSGCKTYLTEAELSGFLSYSFSYIFGSERHAYSNPSSSKASSESISRSHGGSNVRLTSTEVIPGRSATVS